MYAAATDESLDEEVEMYQDSQGAAALKRATSKVMSRPLTKPLVSLKKKEVVSRSASFCGGARCSQLTKISEQLQRLEVGQENLKKAFLRNRQLVEDNMVSFQVVRCWC